MLRVNRPVTRPRWGGLFAAAAVILTLATWVAPVEPSTAQAEKPYTVEVSKFTDLVSGEVIEVDLRTVEGTIVYPGVPSQVYTCRSLPGHDYTAADLTNGTCLPRGVRLSELDSSLDGDLFRRFPDAGPEQGRRAIAILRPGVGPGNWVQNGVNHSLMCGPDDPCRLVYRIQTQTGADSPVEVVDEGPELQYRPVQGVVGCEGQSPDVVTSAMPDRLQDAWLSWTRDTCQQANSPPPTSAFFEPEGNALDSFAAGEVDLTYSAVGYRPGFEPAARRGMVPVPVGLNAVVVAVGGGYPVDDGTWPENFPKPHEQFRLTNDHLAILFGQWYQTLFNVEQHSNAVMANNPQIIGPQYLINANAARAMAVTGPQSTTLFASSHLAALAPDQWTSVAGAPRGIETDLNASDPPHTTDEVDLKTGRPDLARIVYRELYAQGTYYVLTDLATANALGLTVVTIPNAAGDWVTPTAESLAAAVPQMVEQDDGTLVPNPHTTAGYPLTYVEYAMAPAEPLMTPACTARTASQTLLADWLGYMTTDGQGQLPLADGGLVPLTSALQTTASERIDEVGAAASRCGAAPPPPTTPPTTDNTGGAPGSSYGPEAAAGRPGGSGSSSSPGSITNPDSPTRPSDPETVEEALEAAEEDDVDLPGLTGIRAINALWSPTALVAVVVLTTGLALFGAGYQLPEGVRRAAAQGWTAGRSAVRRRLQRRYAREANP